MNSDVSETPSDVARTITAARSTGQRFLGRQVDQRSTLLGQQISDTAATILEIGDEMQKRGRGEWVNNMCEYVAAYIDRVGSYLKNSDGDALGRDFETYAQKQPLVVGTAAILSGFAVSRILRVSALSRTPE